MRGKTEKPRRKWTEEEMACLERNYGRKSNRWIAEKLDRTLDAVQSKAKKMGLGTLNENVDGIPLTMVPDIVGRPYSSIRNTWVNNGLKLSRIGHELAYVTEEELKRFMQSRPDLWNPKECDKYYFYADKWFMEALKAERDGSGVKRYRFYTAKEKAQFVALRDVKGLSYGQLGLKFGMSKKNAFRRYKCWKKQLESA